MPQRLRDENVARQAPKEIDVDREVYGREVSRNLTQNKAVERYIKRWQALGAEDLRVNQHMVNAAGKRVGVNRPDVQFTDTKGLITGEPGKRVYVEFDTPYSNRGPAHEERIMTNDPDGHVILMRIPSKLFRN